MLTTNEAAKFCGFPSIWQFRYAINKAGIRSIRKIGSTNMWDEKDLEPLKLQAPQAPQNHTQTLEAPQNHTEAPQTP